MKRLVIAAACLAALAASSTAFAGWKWSYPVYVYQSPTFSYAAGSIGSARASADGSQYIGCELVANKDYSYMQCWAVDASGKYLSCYNRVNQGMKDAVGAITDGAMLSFQTDPADPTKCGLVQVTTGSQYAPPQP